MKNCLLVVVLFVFGTLLARPWADAQEKTASTEDLKMLKVVVHVNFADAERQKHGLRNVENILTEVEGKATVEFVCHGAGITMLEKSHAKHAEPIAKLIKAGVRFAACENTMREKGIAKDDLLPGIVTVPSGAVEVIRKQKEGYGYFKP